MSEQGDRLQITRREILKYTAAAGVTVFGGRTIAEIYDWFTKTPRKVVETLNKHPESLAQAAKIVHFKALQDVRNATPSYPVDNALGVNRKYMGVTALLKDSIGQSKSFGLRINPIWDRSGAATFEELEPYLPTIAKGVGTFDFNKFPKPVHHLIESGRTSKTFADFAPLEETYLSSLITDEIKGELSRLNSAQWSEIQPILDRYAISGRVGQDADRQFDEETRPIKDKYKKLIVDTTVHISSELADIRRLVEDRRKNDGSPVSPSYVIGYLIYKNGGDIFRGLTDAAYFFRFTARNGFETGMDIGDTTDSRQNTMWMQDNLLDMYRYACWNLMPGIDRYGVFYKPVDNKLIKEAAAMNKDLLDNIRPENIAGTLYHVIANLSSCAKLPWEFVAVPAILTVTLGRGQGSIKFSRELAALSEFPEALSYLNTYATPDLLF